MEVGGRKQGGRCGTALASHVQSPDDVASGQKDLPKQRNASSKSRGPSGLAGMGGPLNPGALPRAVECAAFSRICKLSYGSLRQNICQYVTERATHAELRCVERAIDCLGDR
jgi:hypothetical protein